MRKFSVVFFLILCTVVALSQSIVTGNVTAGVIRYDVCFVGDANSYSIVPQQIKLQNLNVGSQLSCVDFGDYGNFRYTVYDCATNQKLYQKGFSPLFHEWLLVPEAQTTKRSFYQGLFFPAPAQNALLIIDQRTNDNGWKTVYSDTIKPSSVWVLKEKPSAYRVDTIRYSGSSDDKIDLVILSEGYTVNDFKKFRSDAARMTDTLLSVAPYNELSDRFNVFAVSVPSLEQGADQPEKGIYRNTAFNATWNTFESERYLTTMDMKSIYDAAGGVAWDHLILLVNSERYGGGGFYNFFSICSSDNNRSRFVFIHEFGHAFAGLADEYYYDNNDDQTYKEGVEPWEPNITTLAAFDKKWKAMLDPLVPVPTPRDSVYAGKVGLFEGGGYRPNGVYSPVMSCWMKEMKAGGFCPVCREAIRQTILHQSK